jgi:hypothetical protein
VVGANQHRFMPPFAVPFASHTIGPIHVRISVFGRLIESAGE